MSEAIGKHKYAVGQVVQLQARPYEPAARGAYTIVRQLPADNGEFGYRVKSSVEPHERMVRESQLKR
jgi:hypothetical protein